MIPIKEIKFKLASELSKSIDNIRALKNSQDYYNEFLGKTSIFLTALLESHIKTISEGWRPPRWMDDCLITNVKIEKDSISILGIIIWGVENTTKQWTEPFYFETPSLGGSINLHSYTFYFGDEERSAFPYEQFRHNRSYWDLRPRKWKCTNIGNVSD